MKGNGNLLFRGSKISGNPDRAEREQLTAIINRGKHSAQKRKRAQALLLADQGYTDEVIAERVGMHRRGKKNVLWCVWTNARNS
jgi:hypothetical protein